MEIKPTYTTCEQAQLLKEKRFEIECDSYFNGNGVVVEGSHANNMMQRFRYARPEQWVVVEWLRVKHGIWIQTPFSYSDNKKYTWVIEKINEEESNKNCWLSGFDTEIIGFDTPQEAYSAAFDYVLNNLI